MKFNFQKNILGYFQFYYSVVGYRIILYMILSVLVSFMDGLGLAMFMPLLQSVSDGDVNAGKESLGYLHFITSFVTNLGFDLSLTVVLFLLITLFLFKGLFKICAG
ncbi:hypothetical protein [Pontibacter sp. BAB1700]|uniref:hypothetical protein n=1 Tax=Pontibacter sp. BAB1700 TaxID=1144253 RepID=UPI00192A780E|nr:hypothetical protein [Pontibacter sp. BAB1700]